MTGAPLPPQPPGTRRVNHSFYTLFPKPFNGGLLLSRTLFQRSVAGKCCRIHSPRTEDEDSHQPSPPRSSSSPPVGTQQPSPGSARHLAAQGVMGAAPDTTGSLCPWRRVSSLQSPKAAGAWSEMWWCRPNGAWWGKHNRRRIHSGVGSPAPDLGSQSSLLGAQGAGRESRGLWLGCG